MNPAASARRLSVAIIARDAAEALRQTLENVCAIADEIVVVDTGSADDTSDVARQFGAHVKHHAWTNDFAAARNVGWQSTTGDWVLWLDAGERLSDATGVRDFVIRRAFARSAYALLVQIPALGPSGTGEQIARVRLYPRRPELAFHGRVRESASEGLAAANLHLDAAPFPIQRGMREHDPRLKAARALRNVQLAELELREGSRRPELFNCLGDALQTLRQYQRAGDCFRQALMASDRGSTEMLDAYYGLITSLGESTNGRATQIELCAKALEVFPLDAQVLCAMGQYLQAEGRAELAVQAYRTAVEHGQINPLVWHVAEVRDVAAICLSLCLNKQGQTAAALAALREAAARSPQSERVRRHLVDFHIQQGDADEAAAHAVQLPGAAQGSDLLPQTVRAAVLATRKEWLAATSILEAAYAAGCRDPLCLRWLSLARIQRGDWLSARTALLEWQRTDPPNAEIARLLQAVSDAEADRSAA